MQTETTRRQGGVALVMAHPGHELRIHRWLEKTKPKTHVLTDGSGSGSQGRLGSTRKVLAATGAGVGSVFGPWTDQRAYELIFHHSLDELRAVVTSLAEEFVADDVDLVVSDAIEGFNPTHDMCSMITECAIQLAAHHGDRPIWHMDFLLEAPPDAGVDVSDRRATEQIFLHLDEGAWQRKMERALAYPGLRDEVERWMAIHTPDAFRLEVLRPVKPLEDLARLFDGSPPAYESVGEQRVAQGVYNRVLRFREHWLPCAEALRRWAARGLWEAQA